MAPASLSTLATARVVRPLGDWILIEKITHKMSEGGLLHLPQAFNHKSRATLKHGAVADYFRARVLARGPRVPCELEQFDEVMVHTYAEGDGQRLYTGEDSGEKGRMFIKPGDIICAVER